VVMERVPWPRPDRPVVIGAAAVSQPPRGVQHGRARLAQAFGRLIRRQGDRGVFVILSAAMPSRLLSAFPPGVRISRVPLEVAIDRVTERLGEQSVGECVAQPVAQVDQPIDID